MVAVALRRDEKLTSMMNLTRSDSAWVLDELFSLSPVDKDLVLKSSGRNGEADNTKRHSFMDGLRPLFNRFKATKDEKKKGKNALVKSRKEFPSQFFLDVKPVPAVAARPAAEPDKAAVFCLVQAAEYVGCLDSEMATDFYDDLKRWHRLPGRCGSDRGSRLRLDDEAPCSTKETDNSGLVAELSDCDETASAASTEFQDDEPSCETCHHPDASMYYFTTNFFSTPLNFPGNRVTIE